MQIEALLVLLLAISTSRCCRSNEMALCTQNVSLYMYMYTIHTNNKGNTCSPWLANQSRKTILVSLTCFPHTHTKIFWFGVRTVMWLHKYAQKPQKDNNGTASIMIHWVNTELCYSQCHICRSRSFNSYFLFSSCKEHFTSFFSLLSLWMRMLPTETHLLQYVNKTLYYPQTQAKFALFRDSKRRSYYIKLQF